MAGAIGIAAALGARFVNVTCPHCGHVRVMERQLPERLVCPKCRRAFPDPVTALVARR